jgi:molecular chaperone GrpE
LVTRSPEEDTTAAGKAQALAITEAVADVAEPEGERECEGEEWRDRALRLQADMDNYRKRQQRLAQDQVAAERQRLLSAYLPIVDDLERALESPASDARALRQGVELTHRAAVQMLRKEGVERVQAKGQPFDPNWHEAVTTVGRNGSSVEPNTIVQVLEPGYRLGDRLLRPARVVVAV